MLGEIHVKDFLLAVIKHRFAGLVRIKGFACCQLHVSRLDGRRFGWGRLGVVHPTHFSVCRGFLCDFAPSHLCVKTIRLHGPRTLKQGLRLYVRRANRFLIERRGAFDWKCCQKADRSVIPLSRGARNRISRSRWAARRRVPSPRPADRRFLPVPRLSTAPRRV
jgi:hypothetical protein